MNLYSLLNVDFQFEDERGRIVQLIHNDYKQINVLTTKKGVSRGGHYHKVATEAFYLISGTVVVYFEYAGRKRSVSFQEGDFFSIPPYVVHSMFFPENCTMVQMYSIPVQLDNGHIDIYTVESTKEK